jgi:hypothetical protein
MTAFGITEGDLMGFGIGKCTPSTCLCLVRTGYIPIYEYFLLFITCIPYHIIIWIPLKSIFS